MSFLRVGASLALEHAQRLPMQNTCTLRQSIPVSAIFVKLLTTRAKQPMPLRLPLTAHAMITIITAVHNSRSEEHTSELQSRFDLVCRLLLEKKKTALQTRSQRALRHL